MIGCVITCAWWEPFLYYWSSGLKLKVSAFVSVKNLVNLLAYNDGLLDGLLLLCLVIRSALMCWFVHVERRQGCACLYAYSYTLCNWSMYG